MDQMRTQLKPGALVESLQETTKSVGTSVNRGKEALRATTSEAMDSAGADLKTLQSDLRDLKETVSDFISRASTEAAKSAREIAGQVSTAATDIAEKGANAASVAADRATGFTAELESIARRNPLGAVAGALAVGLLIGMMGRRS